MKVNIRIQIPEHLKAILAERAAQSGKDIEAFVADTICEQLELQPSESVPLSSFTAWLDDVRRLVPQIDAEIDDSRESIYAGRGECKF